MKNLIESLGKSEIQTVVAQLQAEMGVSPAKIQGELQDIVTRMPLALFIKDAESRLVLMNPACEALWGVRFSEVKGSRGEKHFPAEQIEIFLSHDRAAFRNGKHSVNEELVWNTLHRHNRWIETYKQATYDAQGKWHLLIGLSIDITERKLSELAMASSLQQLRDLSAHQNAAKESERRRIALEIHDDLAQNLLALKLDVSMLHARTRTHQPLLHQRAGQALSTLDASIVAVRGLINELHPITLELGLVAAIEWQLQQIERRQGLRCALRVLADSAALDQPRTAAIFHVVQTALRYLSADAEAHDLSVTLNLKPERLSITISGDGQPSPETSPRVLDLSAMRERLAAFGGELAVAPLPGAGTVLHMSLPGQS
jgi:two-component system sensor histidine kinase UhpB